MNKYKFVEQVKELSCVSSVSQWRDRYYINLRGNGGNFRGERSSKIWFKEGGELTVELGKGYAQASGTSNWKK